MAISLMDLYGQKSSTAPQSSTLAGMSTPAPTGATTDPYAGFQWNTVDPNQSAFGTGYMDFGNVLKDLGFNGNPYITNTSFQGGVNGNQETSSTAVNPEFIDWLKKNNYSLGASYGGNNPNGAGTAYHGILDSSGKVLGANQYSYDNSKDWIDYAVPLALGGMMGGAANLAFGGAGGAAGGAGTDASLGGADAIAAGAEGGGPTIGNGAFLGEGVTSGVPAWDAAATNAGLSLSAPSGLASMGAPAVFNAAKDSQSANEQLGINTPSTNAPSSVNLGSLGGAGGLLSNPSLIGKIGGGLGSLLGGGQGGAGQTLATLLGLMNANNQMNEWNQQMENLNKMYSPDSPYAKYMEQTLARKDSAAGRNTQYGPRAVDLAAKLTEAKANSMRDLISMRSSANQAQNSGIRDLGSLLSGSNVNGALGQIFSGLGDGWDELVKLFGG